MKELVLQFFLGSFIKTIDEIADNSSLHTFQSFLNPLFILTAFLYGIAAADDFYYNIFWVAWFFSAYFGQSMENEIDRGFWNICFGLVIIGLLYSIQFPLPDVYLPVFLPFLLILSTGNILENIILPNEISFLKLLFSIVVVVCLPLFYIYVLLPILQENTQFDFRYLQKHLSLILGYFFTRVLFKVYLFFGQT